jgi:hypothetical protein
VKILRRLEEANIPESFSNNIYLRAHALQAARRDNKRETKKEEEERRKKRKEKGSLFFSSPEEIDDE